MEKGKRICQALKELRKRIADANNIPFEMEECTHQGDCPGTCPKCESELRYLMDSIDKREQAGKPVVLDGIMSEEELRKAFSITPTEENTLKNPEEMETMGLPASPVESGDGSLISIEGTRNHGDGSINTLNQSSSLHDTCSSRGRHQRMGCKKGDRDFE